MDHPVVADVETDMIGSAEHAVNPEEKQITGLEFPRFPAAGDLITGFSLVFGIHRYDDTGPVVAIPDQPRAVKATCRAAPVSIGCAGTAMGRFQNHRHRIDRFRGPVTSGQCQKYQENPRLFHKRIIAQEKAVTTVASKRLIRMHCAIVAP